MFLFVNVNTHYLYQTKWFEVPLDHFGLGRKETFKIKYLENEDYWNKNEYGPIFFYTGNEGQIEAFANYTGFMWEIAAEYQAKIVFAEHRYYGESKPFGNKSLEKEYIGYLTSAQALADYADLINYLQKDEIKPRYPVIAFGGSYGGMLAAYIRIKYPHLVAGAIAASAPIHMFPGMTKCDLFNRIVTASFKRNFYCSENIQKSWHLIRSYSSSVNGSEYLHKTLNLCGASNATDINSLIEYLESAYVTLAMVNYPFASSFLTPLPAQPVAVVCQYLNQNLANESLLEGIAKAIDVYANYGKKTKQCVDYKEGDNYQNLDAGGWDFQACTEMVMPVCSTGQNDMFEASPWNFTKYSEDCYKKYNVYPRENMARLEYGGDLLQAASNIVFSYGLLDPWTAGGFISSVSDSVDVILIADAAHHLDLMPSSPDDQSPVKDAREKHKQHISKWIDSFRARNKHVVTYL